MSAKEIEERKALVRHFYEEWSKGKAAAMAVTDELCVTDLSWHSSIGKDTHGIKDFKQGVSEAYSAFPDIQFVIDDIVAEGDKVAIRYTSTCTHKGEFMGIPPTNKKMTIWGIEIYRIAGGKIVEGWARMDTLGLMQQLGVVPTPEKVK